METLDRIADALERIAAALEPKGKPSGSKPFQRPTLEEVAAYCRKRRNGIDPQAFWDHYQANGWKVGGKAAMKDWRAAVRTWENTRKQPDPSLFDGPVVSRERFGVDE